MQEENSAIFGSLSRPDNKVASYGVCSGKITSRSPYFFSLVSFSFQVTSQKADNKSRQYREAESGQI